MAKKKQTSDEPELINYGLSEIPIAEIHPSTDNPRREMDEESVKELAESIKQYGVLQPVIIRPDEDEMAPSPWEMVCGHRRLMACQMLGLETIPAIVRELSDDEAFYMMITENLQRKDIEPLDEAYAYRALMEHDKMTVEELCARFGKSVKYIKGRLALNELIPELKDCLKANTLTIGAAIHLSALPMDQQLGFYEDCAPTLSESDKETVISPMSISDVKDFIEESSNRITNFAFSEDPEESWNQRLHKCAGCPFNSASQGALFVDMVEPGVCSNESCLGDKILAYVRHTFDYYLPNIKHANQILEPGDIVLFIDEDPWFRGSAADAKQNLYDVLRHQADELGSFNKANSSRIWNTDEDSRKDAIRVLDLRCLVNGEKGYIQYWNLPKQNSDPFLPHEDTHTDIYRKLGALYDKRQNDIYEALIPMSKTAIETYFGTGSESLRLPSFIENFIACSLINDMSWEGKFDLLGSDTSIRGVCGFMVTHTLSDVLKAVMLNMIDNSYKPYLLEMIMEGCAESASAEVTAGIYEKYKPKIDKLVGRLKEMGYDEFDRPLNGDDESPEHNIEDENIEDENIEES